MINLQSPDHPWWQRSKPLALFLATVSLYAVTIGFDFQLGWDDDIYLLENEFIRSITFPNIVAIFTGYFLGNYAPLHISSYMVEHAVWGLNPAGYHLTNILLHASNGILFYFLLRRLDVTEWRATIAAWIFLAHPVQVETVAWISQRKNLLAMAFFLLAFLGYDQYRRSGRVAPYLLAAGGMTAAALSKSIAVIFPAAALLYDLTMPRPVKRTWPMRLLEHVPFILIALATAVVAMNSQALDSGGGRRQYHGGSPLATFFTMVPVLVSYLRDCVWPFALSPFYDIPERLKPDGQFFAAGAFLVIVLCGGGFLYHRQRELSFWFGFFFISLIPVLQIVPLITLKNDRYLYFPLLGFATLATYAGAALLQRMGSWGKVPIYGCLLLLPLLTFRQALPWRNDLTLWAHAVAVDPGNRQAVSRLIDSYTRRDDLPGALAVSRRYQEEFYRRQQVSPP